MIWLGLLLFAMPAGAQSRAAKAERWPIESLTVEGNHNYTREQILAVAGLKIGQLAGKQEFDAARDRLVASGVFETVGYKFEPGAGHRGYAATFQVVEAAPFYTVRFESLGVPDKELAAYLKGKDPLFGPRLPATRRVIERYTQWIQEYVTARHGPKILSRVVPLTGEQLAIVFRPARAEPAVAEVSFTGNQVLPSSMLQAAISDVAVGTPYSEDRFRQFLDNSIRPLYDARGRIRVSFPKIVVEKAKDVEGLAVTVTVNEGVTYDVGKVRLEPVPGFRTEDLLKAGKFKSGGLADFNEINQGVGRIKDLLKHQGYLRSDVQIVRQIDDATKTVDLLLRVDKGPQYLFRTLQVEGLDLNGEAAIRQMWTMKEGRPYSPTYADYFLGQVREEGIFDNLGDTRAEAKIDDQAHRVDVTLYFKGGAPPARKRKEPSPF
jgi:outer membrane protein insertion porin family